MKKFKSKTILSILWAPGRVEFLLSRAEEDLNHGHFSGGAAEAASQIRDLIGKIKPDETILVMPRSEVLQKEITFEKNRHEDFEAKLSQLLPYSPKEMAYSVVVDPAEKGEILKGLVYAIPEPRIKEILESFKSSGLSVDEVISEDQTVFWFLREKAAEGPALLLDKTGPRIFVLFFRGSSILLSSSYPSGEELKNILSEVSFSLLETGLRPLKVYARGDFEEGEIARILDLPVEAAPQELFNDTPLPMALSGIKKRDASPSASLLPLDQKLEKRSAQKKHLLYETLFLFGVFLLSLALFAGGHLFFLYSKKTWLENDLKKIEPTVSETRRIQTSLSAIREAEKSKERLLSFLMRLAEEAPPGVRVKELQIEPKKIVFRGESSSHALLTQFVQTFEKIEGVKETKLEYARLRKKLNEDYFDFEVTARWLN